MLQLIPNLTPKQERFIKLFASLFNIRDAKGNLKPFIPTPFQQEFLKDSIVCNENPKHRIVVKGRGLGFTALIAGELLIAATIMPKVKIPVTSITAKTANVLIDWCIDLADNSNDLGYGKIERDKNIDSAVRLKNGSQIIPISGGSPESIRSLRAPVLVLDEFAFNAYQKEILTAGERCLSEGGQITIISTPRTADPINDEYWRILSKAEELGYKRYEFPVFPKDKFNVNKPIPEQGLEPIAPWLSIEELEKARKRDPIMFMREQQCTPMDESVAFLSWEIIKKSCILDKGEVHDAPTYCGIDVGRTQDLTAIEIFQKVDGIFYQVDEVILRNMEIPRQVEEIKSLDFKYNFDRINIDKTGIGLGLYEYTRKALGSKTRGVQFTKENKVMLANNLRTLMQDEKIYLLRNDNLMDDLHSVPYDTLNSLRTKEGHADRFWAVALAVMKERGRVIDAGEILDDII